MYRNTAECAKRPCVEEKTNKDDSYYQDLIYNTPDV